MEFTTLVHEYAHLCSAVGYVWSGRVAPWRAQEWEHIPTVSKYRSRLQGIDYGALSLIPNFDFIAIRISDVHVRVAWSELASAEKLPAGVRDFANSRIDVTGGNQTETEVCDAT
jgi:hypothetical protein